MTIEVSIEQIMDEWEKMPIREKMMIGPSRVEKLAIKLFSVLNSGESAYVLLRLLFLESTKDGREAALRCLKEEEFDGIEGVHFE